MSTITHEGALTRRKTSWLEARDLWASIAISVIWLAVLFVSLFGPDFVSTSAGGSFTKIPSGIAVAFFALFATMSIAKYGFSRKTDV
jgi:polyferredoxin